MCCISLYSYIKPQLKKHVHHTHHVVYLYIPTSNHNRQTIAHASLMLYIFIFLHQTTTAGLNTYLGDGCISLYSYIKPQLHYFTHHFFKVVYLYIPTSNHNVSLVNKFVFVVVYLYIPTSNHNIACPRTAYRGLYIFIFLHQTTTCFFCKRKKCKLYIFIFLHQTTTFLFHYLFVVKLYIFIFLHQTTTGMNRTPNIMRCISLYSYIKPQRNSHR